VNEVFIYDAIRSARTKAKPDGGLAALSPMELVASLLNTLTERTNLDPKHVEDVTLGCVTQAVDQAANVAKTSLMVAGWPDHVPGITVNRFCSSGLDACNIAAMKVMAGQAELTIGGGVEMMSRVPMLSDKATAFHDQSFAIKNRFLLMGAGADFIATRYNCSREDVDQIALLSQTRAAAAQALGYYASLVPVHNPHTGQTVDFDECVRGSTTAESLAGLPPAFEQLGAAGSDALQIAEHPEYAEIRHVHTAGNSPAMCDGAAVVLIGNQTAGEQLGIAPRARIVQTQTTCDDPLEVVGGCVKAVETLLDKLGLTVGDIDLFEIHEAFAATSIKLEQLLGLKRGEYNVNGGCIALGHPMGATGAMMLGTLLDELERRDLKTGIVATSGAAGTGTAMLIERC